MPLAEVRKLPRKRWRVAGSDAGFDVLGPLLPAAVGSLDTGCALPVMVCVDAR